MHIPSTGTLALIATGTPANGRVSPGWISSAAASARSASTSMKAFKPLSSSAIRSSEACTSSRADSSPPRTRAAKSPAGVNMRSLEAMGAGARAYARTHA
jgi:hypothetical protein